MEYIFYLFCFCVLYVIVANFLFLRHFSRKDLQIKAEYFDGMINLYIKNNSGRDLYINSAGVFNIITQRSRSWGWIHGSISIPKHGYDITPLLAEENMPISLFKGGTAELSMPFEINSTKPTGVYIDVSHYILDKNIDNSLYERKYTYNFLGRSISKYYYLENVFFRIYQK